MATLLDLRQHIGLTQMALASKVGCTPAQVSGWELGHTHPSIKYLRPLAKAFGVSEGRVLDAIEETRRVAVPRTKKLSGDAVIPPAAPE
jgi:transcriptional regulator with XRE-family HTH domain